MNNFKIRHSVVFRLRHAKGSAEEKTFFTAANKLSIIPGVNRFECLTQVSPKNAYDYGLSMEFASSQDYEAYQNDRGHKEFVETYWIKNVAEFLELDFEIMDELQ